MSITAATDIIEILGPIAEAIPILGTPVKSALEVISKILKYADVCTYFFLRLWYADTDSQIRR
jgi:hypothetical protein